MFFQTRHNRFHLLTQLARIEINKKKLKMILKQTPQISDVAHYKLNTRK